MQDQKQMLEEEKQKLETRLVEIEKQLQQVMLPNNEARSKLVADVINSVYCGLNARDVIIYLVNYLDAHNGNKNANRGYVDLDMDSFGWDAKTRFNLQEIIRGVRLS